MKEIEEWRAIKDYPNYMVSSLGRVKSIDNIDCRGRFIKGRIRIANVTYKGYLRLTLCKNGKNKKHFIHRLVAEAFIQNDDPEHKTQVNHINENKQDNCVTNLEWVTPSQNVNHGSRNKKTMEKQLNDKNKSKPICQYTLDMEFVKEYPSAHEIERVLGFAHSNIIACCKQKQNYNTAYGYIWMYKEKGAA